jgi:hypothetical protein
MKRVLSALIVILTITLVASAQTTFYYAHVVDGVQGSVVWKTTILLTNPSASSAASGMISFTADTANKSVQLAGSTLTLSLTDETGATTSGSTFPFSIPPLGTHELVSSGGSRYQGGFATVTTTSGAVGGTAIFSEFDTAGNLIGEAGVPSASALPGQAIFVDTNGGFSTGVAYANPGGTAASVTLKLLDSSAVSVASTTVILGSGNHVAQFTSQMFTSAPALVGTVQITSNSPLAAIALRFDPSFTKFTTLPPVSLASLINPALEWLQQRAWLTPLSSVARLLGALQLRIG